MRGGDELWTAERIELLRTLWSKGETAVAIAIRLGGGLSRSAVLGKIYRLRLHTELAPVNAPTRKRNKNAGSAAGIERRRRRTTYKKRAPVDTTPAPVRQYKSLLELTNITCRWPHGRPGTDRFFFCGAPEADLEHGIPYCPRHMQRAYPTGTGAGGPSPSRWPSRKAHFERR